MGLEPRNLRLLVCNALAKCAYPGGCFIELRGAFGCLIILPHAYALTALEHGEHGLIKGGVGVEHLHCGVDELSVFLECLPCRGRIRLSEGALPQFLVCTLGEADLNGGPALQHFKNLFAVVLQRVNMYALHFHYRHSASNLL